jgi:hypothetical protein
MKTKAFIWTLVLAALLISSVRNALTFQSDSAAAKEKPLAPRMMTGDRPQRFIAEVWLHLLPTPEGLLQHRKQALVAVSAVAA